MKKMISLLSLFVAMISTANAQSHCGAPSSCQKDNSSQESTQQSSVEATHVIVMINTASWCGVCKANGPRVEMNVVSKYMGNDHYTIVKNDLSDEQTKKASIEACNKAGIEELAKETKYTGMIYFIDPVSKRIVDSISVAKSDAEISAVFDKFK